MLTEDPKDPNAKACATSCGSQHDHHHHAHDHHERARDAHDGTHDHPQGAHDHHHTHDHHHCCGHEHHHVHGENHWLKAGVGIGFGVVKIALALAGIALPMTWIFILTGISTALTLYLGFNIYQSAFESLRRGEWDHATLYTISSLVLVTVSIVGLFVPVFAIHDETAPMILGFWHLGEAIEHTLIDKLEEKLDIRDCLPKDVIVDGSEVAVEALNPGDVITIQPNEVIPVDGVLQEDVHLRTTRVDGSPILKHFRCGDKVKSGVQLPEHSHPIQVTVSKPYAESHLSLEAEKTQRAHQEKAPLEVLTSQILKYFTPTLLGIAFISGVTIGILFTPMLGIQCAVTVLVSACPCVLSLITPMTVKLAMKKGNDLGVRIKGSKAIQSAAEVDDVVFDLNGTLTEGKSSVTDFNLGESDNYAAHLALLESNSTHDFARAISTYLQEGENPPNTEGLTIEELDDSHHSGLRAQINGEWFIVGNKDMLASHNIAQFPPEFSNPERGQIYFVKDGVIIGQIQVNDKIRPDAIPMLRALEGQGKRIHLATGADHDTAIACATILGIPHTQVYANSADGTRSKTEPIESLQAQGHSVGMVGDAANDVSAIARANLGIAVQSPTADDITVHEADIVLQQGDLFPIAQTFEIATTAKETIVTNLGISLGYNTAVTLLSAGSFVALGFTLNPVIGVALMILESTIVLLVLLSFKISPLETTLSDEVRQQHSGHRFFNGANADDANVEAANPADAANDMDDEASCA